MERKLAAILAADVVGYSRLMEQDEAGTFERLRAHRKELFEPEIARHHGRVFKLMGDGLLAEFASAVNAVECAIAVQRGLAERNAGLPEGQRIDCRIGVNLGDLIVETESGGASDMHGDGVNIASRLQTLAEPGEVLVSGVVYDQLKKKVEAGFEFLGEQKVKNIAEPVRLYRVLQDPAQTGRTIDAAKAKGRSWRWPSAAAAAIVAFIAAILAWTQPWQEKIQAASVANMVLPLPDKPSIAVLPFANMSGDSEQEYFADGMTDDVITELSRISGLFVISRNSIIPYKGKNPTPKQVSEELGVRYVLQGNVQHAGNQLRINAWFVDAIEADELWSDQFDGSVDEVFALQDKVTKSVVDAIAVKLSAAEQSTLSAAETAVLGAYDAFLRGMEQYRLTTGAGYAKAIPEFEQAIRLDPGYARAYAMLALLYVRAATRGYTYDLGLTPPEAIDRAQRYVELAKKGSPAVVHQINGYQFVRDGHSEKAIAEFKEAITANPGDAWNYALMGWALTGNEQPKEGLEHLHTAIRLNPRDTVFLTYWLGLAYFGLEQFDEAAHALESAVRANADDEYAYALLAATYGYLDRKEAAASAISRYNEIRIGKGDVALTIKNAPYLASHKPQGLLPIRARIAAGWRASVLSRREFLHAQSLDGRRSARACLRPPSLWARFLDGR